MSAISKASMGPMNVLMNEFGLRPLGSANSSIWPLSSVNMWSALFSSVSHSTRSALVIGFFGSAAFSFLARLFFAELSFLPVSWYAFASFMRARRMARKFSMQSWKSVQAALAAETNSACWPGAGGTSASSVFVASSSTVSASCVNASCSWSDVKMVAKFLVKFTTCFLASSASRSACLIVSMNVVTSAECAVESFWKRSTLKSKAFDATVSPSEMPDRLLVGR
mmetsp:Transcript_20377/g.44260  ORF Transcript_20377/g.44260 Transcript_20377/m.44260 type:complete len:224 (-) Transcript_20377:921-1592(-)